MIENESISFNCINLNPNGNPNYAGTLLSKLTQLRGGFIPSRCN
jgi:hypothetical protein